MVNVFPQNKNLCIAIVYKNASYKECGKFLASIPRNHEAKIQDQSSEINHLYHINTLSIFTF